MELNRNQWFFVGIVVLLLGIQFRVVQEYVLTHEATRFLAERTASESDSSMLNLASDFGVGAQKVIKPPDWLGWCSISVGAVLILHSLAMRRPG